MGRDILIKALPKLVQTEKPLRPAILLVDDDPFLSYARRAALERSFLAIERVPSAAEAFIRIEEPDVASQIVLVVVSLHLPGLTGPSVVNEFTSRLPNVPILAIGRAGEIAPDYAGEHVRFLPEFATTEDLLSGVMGMLAAPHANVA